MPVKQPVVDKNYQHSNNNANINLDKTTMIITIVIAFRGKSYKTG